MPKKRNTLILLILIIAGIFVAANWGKLPFAVADVKVSDPTFIYPSWGRLECAPLEETYTESNSLTVDNLRGFHDISCNIFSNHPCEIWIKVPDFSALTTFYRVYWTLNPNSQCKTSDYCSSQKVSSISYSNIQYEDQNVWYHLTDINPGEVINLHAEGAFSYDQTYSIKKRWILWGLLLYYDGAKDIKKKGNCDLVGSAITTESKVAIPSGVVVTSLEFEGGKNVKWVNFVTKWLFGPPTNVFKHPVHGEVYCEAGNLWTIRTLKTADGTTYRLASRDYYDATGNEYITKAESLPSTECCPGQTSTTGLRCSDNFKWEIGASKCDVDSDCPNEGAWVTLSSKTIVREYCDKSISPYVCKSQTKTVQCATEADCIGEEYCDNTDWTCKGIPSGPYCGDGICSRTESITTCPQDCRPVPPGPITIPIWAYIVGGFLVLLIIILILRRRR